MRNKTCVECRYMLHKDTFEVCTHSMTETSMFNEACKHFAPPTNGDVIRQGNNRKLAEIFDDLYNGNKCKYCINYISGNCKFEDKHAEYDEGGWVEDEDCISGFETWLNAPVEMEESENEC